MITNLPNITFSTEVNVSNFQKNGVDFTTHNRKNLYSILETCLSEINSNNKISITEIKKVLGCYRDLEGKTHIEESYKVFFDKKYSNLINDIAISIKNAFKQEAVLVNNTTIINGRKLIF